MIPRNSLRLLVLAPCLTLVCSAQDSQPRPSGDQAAPQETRAAIEYKVGDLVKTPEHASRWEYPKEFTLPAGFRLHLVEKGDTLWDLGQKNLGNPYAWPQIWEHNKWIKDPHWIFPGDPLLIPDQSKTLAKATEVPESTAPTQVAQMEPESPSTYKRLLSSEMAYTYQDFLQLPYVAEEGSEAHFKTRGAIRIAGGEKVDHANFTDGDKIFLDGGQDRSLKVGDRRVIVKVIKKRLFHPDDTRRVKPLGDVIQHVGVVRILHVTEKGSIAIIERCLDGVERGQMLIPFTEPASIPLALRKNSEGKEPNDPITPTSPSAKIVHIGDAVSNVANGAQVIIDKGEAHGLKVGNMLLGVQEDEWSVGNPRERTHAKERTFRYIGQAIVIHLGQNTATCRIVRAKDSFQVGTVLFK